MPTVITKELAVINNKLCSIRRHVRLVMESQYFEIEIVRFEKEPRILSFCGDCARAMIKLTTPPNCGDIKNMRRTEVSCKENEDIWKESECPSFSGNKK